MASKARGDRGEVDAKKQLARLEEMVRARTGEMWNYVAELETAQRDLRLLHEETVSRLSLVAEFRDDETPRHVKRMSHYCGLIADRLGLDPDRCEQVRMASAL